MNKPSGAVSILQGWTDQQVEKVARNLIEIARVGAKVPPEHLTSADVVDALIMVRAYEDQLNESCQSGHQ